MRAAERPGQHSSRSRLAAKLTILVPEHRNLDLELRNALLDRLQGTFRRLEPLLRHLLVEQTDLDLVREVLELRFESVTFG